MVFEYQSRYPKFEILEKASSHHSRYMTTSYLRQGFLVFLIAALFLGGIELLVGEQSFLTFSSGKRTSGILKDVEEQVDGPEEQAVMVEEVPDLPPPPDEMTPPDPLTRFYDALLRLREEPDQTKVRIAYFGDSMIEGDLVTQTLRHQMQEIFGGQGVGFVPTTSLLWDFGKPSSIDLTKSSGSATRFWSGSLPDMSMEFQGNCF